MARVGWRVGLAGALAIDHRCFDAADRKIDDSSVKIVILTCNRNLLRLLPFDLFFTVPVPYSLRVDLDLAS